MPGSTAYSLSLPELQNLLQQAQSLQSLKRKQQYPIENLVLEGGGVKGLAYVGALQVLAENELLDSVKRVAGSSAGGIMSMLIAVGHSPAEIEKIMSEEINFSELMDSRNPVDPTRMFKAAGMPMGLIDIYTLFQHKGLYQGEKFLALSKKIVARKIEQKLKALMRETESIETPEAELDAVVERKYQDMLEKYHIKDPALITFKQLNELNQEYPNLKFKELYVTGTKVRDGSLKVFSAESSPNMPIVDAVRITMSFPFGFEPVQYQSEYYIDGGVADNYPMRIFDSPKFLSHGLNEANVNPCTLGLLLDSDNEINARWGLKIENKPQRPDVSSLINGVMQGLQMKSEVLKQFYSVNSVQIFDEHVQTMDFNLDNKKKAKLQLSGRQAMQSYIDNYRGEGVISHPLPDYQDFKEKIYSKRPEELISILENEICPLLQEITTIFKILNKNDLEKEEAEIADKISQFGETALKQQNTLYDTLQEMADFCEYIDNQLKIAAKERLLLENRRNTLIQRNEVNELKEFKEKYQEIDLVIFAAINKEKELLAVLREKKKEMNEVEKGLNHALYNLINKQRIMMAIKKEKTLETLAHFQEILNEQMDEILLVLESEGRFYPDLRTEGQFESKLRETREEQKKRITQLYQEEHFYTESAAKKYGELYDEVLQDILLFGFKLDVAQIYAHYFLSNYSVLNENEGKVRDQIFKNLLIEKLIKLKMVTRDNEENIVWFEKHWEEALHQFQQRFPTMSSGYAQYLAKEQVIRQWKGTAEVLNVDDLDFLYTKSLQQTVQQLSRGKWSGSINITNRLDTFTNATLVPDAMGETEGRQASSYLVNTSIYETPEKYSYLSNNKQYRLPPIKIHLLQPEFLSQHKSKEIIVAFEQPGAAEKEKQFALASKYAKHREAQFSAQKEAIMKQIKTACKGSEKITLTIMGEGLAGQDAQYLFSALINELNLPENDSLLQSIGAVDLKLVDPCRVSTRLASEAKEQVRILKMKNPKLSLQGYNLIQQKSYAGVTKKRRPRNYIGEANITGQLSEDAAQVVAEFRDLYDGELLYKRATNEKKGAVLSADLDKSNLWYTGAIYRQLNTRLKDLKIISRSVFFDFFPTLLGCCTALPLQMGSGLIKRTTGPIFRLYHLFKKPKSSFDPKVNWAKQRKESENKNFPEKEVEKSEVLQENIIKLVEKTHSEQRLQRIGRPPIENLVFAGGMGKSIVYTGALMEMQENKMLSQVQRVAGSSEGGLIAALFAIGFDPSELSELMKHEFNSPELQDAVLSLSGLDKLFAVKGVDVSLTGIISSLSHKGIYKGDALKVLLKKLIEAKLEQKMTIMLFENLNETEIAELTELPSYLGEGYRNNKMEAYLNVKLKALKKQYGIKDFGEITFSQLKALSDSYPALGFKEIYLTGTKLSDASLKVFSYESEPHMPLVEAIRITTSTPLKYIPAEYEGEYYVSGNIANDFPMEIFDQAQFLSHGLNDAGTNPCSFGLMVNEDAYRHRWGMTPLNEKDLTLGELLDKVFKGMYSRASIVAEKYNINTVVISEKMKKEASLKRSFFLGKKYTLEGSEQLVQMGKEAMRQYHALYEGEEVVYSPAKPYLNFRQKYYSMPIMELKRILESEVLPLQNELYSYEQSLKSEVTMLETVERQRLLDLISEANKRLSDEKETIINALKLKGVIYQASEDKRKAPVKKAEAIIQSTPKTVEPPRLLVTTHPQHKRSVPLPVKALFMEAFPEAMWHHQLTKNVYVFTHKEHDNQKIMIEQKKDNMIFYGSPTHKIVDAAKAYQHSLLKENKTVKFQIEAENLEDAYRFLRELHAAAFDIDEIAHIKISGELLLVDKAKIITDVKSQLNAPISAKK